MGDVPQLAHSECWLEPCCTHCQGQDGCTVQSAKREARELLEELAAWWIDSRLAAIGFEIGVC